VAVPALATKNNWRLLPNTFTHVEEIPAPPNYVRKPLPAASFGHYLRRQPLQKSRTVLLHNGLPKANQYAQFAVLGLAMVPGDLQQCADAIMRLRAEYLRSLGLPVVFKDSRGTAYHWPGMQHRGWQGYLMQVFAMCGTASLANMLKSISWPHIQVGDVVIKPGYPGHAMLVIDVAEHVRTGEKIFMLAQSYMPAQQMHIVVNPASGGFSPWYTLPVNGELITPEWVFGGEALRRW
ncbi:MAG TPA: DUF4846 domain-containing protein, partial [Phnomibacter sp.]|nr:DUF4846 domain-containing protein [Phnomibacter sp.]